MNTGGQPHNLARPSGLSVTDGVAVLVGVVIGIGVFGFPPLVAQQVNMPWLYMSLWVAGGLIMLIGALCYAELGSAYPDAGGEYYFLTRAWGPQLGLLFAWARGTVIQTGSIAAVAFIYGEYAAQLIPMGNNGNALHAALAVLALTALNIAGTGESKRLQLLFTFLTVLALLSVVIAGLLAAEPTPPALPIAPHTDSPAPLASTLGLGMVFVLLTYGGWNEAAYLSGELRNPRRDMSRILLLGTGIVVMVYLVTNFAYLQIFGLEKLGETDAVGAALMNLVAGPMAATLLSLLVCLAALSTINATILTGARVYYALGRDIPQLRMLSAWNDRGETPRTALLVQGVITLALILFGALAKDGIQTMVAYTAPVFWLFMLLTALALIRLRQLEPVRERPFRVPLYPLTPVIFALTCLGLFWSSTRYAGLGALIGLAVLVAGMPLLLFSRHSTSPQRL